MKATALPQSLFDAFMAGGLQAWRIDWMERARAEADPKLRCQLVQFARRYHRESLSYLRRAAAAHARWSEQAHDAAEAEMQDEDVALLLADEASDELIRATEAWFISARTQQILEGA